MRIVTYDGKKHESVETDFIGIVQTYNKKFEFKILLHSYSLLTDIEFTRNDASILLDLLTKQVEKFDLCEQNGKEHRWDGAEASSIPATYLAAIKESKNDTLSREQIVSD